MNYTVIDADTHFGFLPSRDTDVSIGKLLSSMDEYGIACGLSHSLKGAAYDFEEGNDETLAVSRTDPRILPVATVDPYRYIGAVDEIEKRKNQGFVAFRVFPEQQGWDINSIMFRPILRELDRLGMPLIVGCVGGGGVTGVLRAVEGSSMPVILCGVTYSHLADALAACRERPGLYIEAQIIDTPDSLEVAVEAVGVERFVFGSNHPSTCMRASLNMIVESRLSEEEKSLIFSGNIRRVLGGISVPEGVTLKLDAPFAGIPIVDVHSHYGKWSLPMRRWGIGLSLDLMRRRGISKTVMSSSYAIVYNFIEGNELLSRAIEGHPELLGYVTVNPNYFEASCRELEKYLEKPNFVGVKIHPHYCRQAINSPKNRTLVRKVAEYGCPLLIHTYGSGAADQVLELAHECPRLPIIMGHGGAEAWREAVEVVKQTDNVYLEFCCSFQETGKVRRTVEMVGADRLLFGSDLDLIHPGFIAGVYEEARLGREDTEKVLYRNASALFGIQP